MGDDDDDLPPSWGAPPPSDEDAPRSHLRLTGAEDAARAPQICRRADGIDVDPGEWAVQLEQCEAQLQFGSLVQGRALKKTALAVDTVLRLHPHWAGTIRYNQMSRRDECGGEDAARVLTTRVRLWLERHYQCEAPREIVDDALHSIAAAHPYHPVQQYLERLPPWDEVPRIGELVNILDVPADTRALSLAYLQCWMVGAIKRVLEPGAKMDYLVVLSGKQGSKKSTFWRALGGGYPCVGGLAARHWTDAYRLHSAWIHELGELESVTTRKELAEIKEHIAETGETFSLKHEKQATTWLRRFVFCGTTNRDDFLRDETGERRFWIIATGKTELSPIDTGYIERARDQLWAEALHLYRAGADCYLSDPGLIRQHNAQAEKFSAIEDPWTDAVGAVLAEYAVTRTPLTTSEILDGIKIPLEKRTRMESNRVGEILRRSGMKYQAIRRKNGIVKGWTWPAL